MLIPLGLFFLTYFFRKDTSELKKFLKEKKEEIKETKKELEKEIDKQEKEEENLKKSVEKTEGVVNENLGKKSDRDEKAKKFFKDL
jgi:prefoldin subunit 5